MALKWWCQLGALILTSCQSLNRWGSKHGSSVQTAPSFTIPTAGFIITKRLIRKRAYDILSWLESENYYYEVFTGSAIYTPQNGRELLDVELDRFRSANPEADLSVLKQAAEVQYSQSGFAYINSFQELFEADQPIDFYNILGFSFFKEKLEAGWKRYEHAEDLTLVSSAEHNFELSSRKASKGQALKKLAEQLNISLEETAAVGDSLNDKSMLEAAGKGVAMGNAREDIKSIADAVTLTNDEHGVAHMMKHLL